MTHYTVGIIIPKDERNIETYVATAMAPYDENTSVAPYVCYSVEHAKAELARDIQRFERIVERRDPEYDLTKCHEHLEVLRRTTPAQKYREYVEHHESFNRAGQPISTYNPASKWDWYVIGGRWDGWIHGKETSNQSVADNIATTEQMLEHGKIPHALLTPNGQWHEQGQLGWWGILLTENDDWDAEARRILTDFPAHHVVIVDAHI
jgi:hypothetical protein